MHVQIVNFNLKDMTDAGFPIDGERGRAGLRERARAARQDLARGRRQEHLSTRLRTKNFRTRRRS
jgi:hypothetical protein